MSPIQRVTRAQNHLEDSSPYGYRPSQAPGVAYLVSFSLAAILHIGLGFRYKYWIVFVTLIPGGLLEIIGWAGRLWSSKNDLNSNPFLMQICCLILGPAFFSAWAYTVLGYCITRLGSAYSLVKPKMYLAIFVTADVISLVLQAIGGGKAAVAAEGGTDTKPATRIMLAGILFQLGTMTIFTVLALDFILRVIAHRPYAHRHSRTIAPTDPPATLPSSETEQEGEGAKEKDTFTPTEAYQTTPTNLRHAQLLLAGIAFASTMIYVRGVYRSIELAQGWSGYLITHENYFTYLDGLPMALCFSAFAALHPGWLLPRREGWKNA